MLPFLLPGFFRDIITMYKQGQNDITNLIKERIFTMNIQMLDLLDKIVAQDFEGNSALLTKEGVLTSNSQMVLNKINLMTGTYASNLADGILEADMDLQEVVTHMESLQEQNQYIGIYFFLMYLFAALEMDIPYLFMQLPSHTQVLQYYIQELISDLKDFSTDQDD